MNSDDKKPEAFDERQCECADGECIIVQYRNTPEAWDGYSEYRCSACGRRWGRWSGKELRENESEPRSLRYYDKR